MAIQLRCLNFLQKYNYYPYFTKNKMLLRKPFENKGFKMITANHHFLNLHASHHKMD